MRDRSQKIFYCKVNCQFMAETDHPLTAVQLTKSYENPYPYLQKPIPLTRGTGFVGYGCGLPWKAPGLPAPIPNFGSWVVCHSTRSVGSVALYSGRLLVLNLFFLYIVVFSFKKNSWSHDFLFQELF